MADKQTSAASASKSGGGGTGTTIVIKRPKKVHGGHHGGSWKVAYADFVTAMMAFFLLMWLLSMSSPEKKAALSQYFSNYNIFQGGGGGLLDKMQGGLLLEIQGKYGHDKSSGGESANMTDKDPAKPTDPNSSEGIKARLVKDLALNVEIMKDQVLVDIFGGSVRIQMVDKEGSEMFPSGSTLPTGKARAILKIIAQNIKNTPHKIAVEGHTDSVPYTGNAMTNWELSTGRASVARQELERDGVPANKIARVVGYADTEPLLPQDTKDPRNRRISIIVLSKESPKADAKNIDDLKALDDMTKSELSPSASEQRGQ